MDLPYMNPTQYANHIMHMNKLIKNVSKLHPSLAHQLTDAVMVLEHHNNALEAQVETIERMSVSYGRRC